MKIEVYDLLNVVGPDVEWKSAEIKDMENYFVIGTVHNFTSDELQVSISFNIDEIRCTDVKRVVALLICDTSTCAAESYFDVFEDKSFNAKYDFPTSETLEKIAIALKAYYVERGYEDRGV